MAGGSSSRLGQDKGLLRLAQKPLITHVLDAARGMVEEEIVVVSSKAQADNYRRALASKVKILIDEGKTNSPLVGASTGFEQAQGKCAILLPCDTPFVSKKILSLAVELCVGRSAVIPRWPNGFIEPLQAAYSVKPALEAARKASSDGRMNLRSMTERLAGVRYVSTLVLQQLDPTLRTFFNVNTPSDLRKAEQIVKRLRQTSSCLDG